MSQIDKAFLTAYAKKRPIQLTSDEVQPLQDPTGERILRIHLPNNETLPPFAPAAPAVHISQATTRIASSSSIRRESSSSVTPQVAASNVAPPPTPTKAIASSAELPPRKTLTSYLQQARQTSVPTALPTPVPTAKPSKQPAPVQPSVHESRPAMKPLAKSTKQLRVDAPHSSNPPVARPESTMPWSFGTVERSIKATADSKSISARTQNEVGHQQPLPSAIDLKVPSDVVMKFDRAAKASETKPNNHFAMETPASRASSRAPTTETQRRTPPLGRNLNSDSLAKITLPIQPAWEVDDFLWPNAVANLLVTQSAAFHEIGLHLQHAQSKGLRVLSITSGERGVGRSTVAMCLAKTLSKLGMKIALLDGDYECPSLVDQLNLETQHGWQQCLLENVPLDEVAIHAVEEAITLFPMTDSIAISQVATHTIRINKLIKRISSAYDMVIIDANRVTQKQSQLLGTGEESALDATLLIVDAELSLRQRIDAAVDLVRQQGVQSVGLVENFQS